jgi:hypothetical protein
MKMAKAKLAIPESVLKQPRHRSPNYPAIDLEKAVDKVLSLYKSAKTHFVPVAVAQDKWGYKPLSSVADQAVAALKAFGLIDVEGEGKNRQLRVSEAARRIMLGSPDRATLLAQAALSPPIHKAVWEKYGEIGLPENDVLRSYLVFDLKFNEASVDSFMAEFRHSLSYANVASDDKMPADEQEYEFVPQEGFNVTVQPQANAQHPNMVPAKPGYSDFPLYFPNNRKGILQVPGFTSKQDYALLKQQVDHIMGLMKAISGLWGDESSAEEDTFKS